MAKYKILEFIIKPLLRYQDTIFLIFNGFWSGPVSGQTRYMHSNHEYF